MELTKKISKGVAISKLNAGVRWCFGVFWRAALLTGALVGWFFIVALFIPGGASQADLQHIAFLSNSDFVSGVISIRDFLKSTLWYFCLILCVCFVPKTSLFKKGWRFIAEKYYRRFIKPMEKASLNVYFSAVDRSVGLCLCLALVVLISLVLFFSPDKPATWPPKLSEAALIESTSEIRVLLPDGRKIVGSGFAMVNKNTVELTFKAPVDPYE